MTTITTPSTQSVVASTDTYTWANQYGGAWGTGSNWFDTSVGSAVIAAPGSASTVRITGGIGDNFVNVLGIGATAQLSITNDVLVWGTVAVGGALSLAASSGGISTELDLDGGASITAASLNLGNDATLEVAGSKLIASGTATLTSAFLLAVNTGTVQLGGLIANPFIGTNGSAYGTIAVDDSASIEIGTKGGAAAGAITIDQGLSAALCGMIQGNVVVNGALSVQAGASLYIDISNPFGSGSTIRGTGTLSIGENSQLTLGVADSATISFAAPGGILRLYVLPTGSIRGFTSSDTIVLIGLATGMSYAQTTADVATLTLTKGATVVGTLTLAGNYAASLFHMRIDGHGNEFITLQNVGTAPVQPTLITGSAGYDTMIATANNQTLTALGGNDSLSGGSFTGIDFKDTSANLNGCTITSFSAYDVIDLTDMKLASVTGTFTSAVVSAGLPTVPATFTVRDGTHSATILFSPSTPLPFGYWTVASDGAAGTNLRFIVINTDAYTYNKPLGGSLSTLANWQDTTTAATAALQPGYGNSLTFNGAAAYMDIAGTAAVAALSTNGSVLLTGTISAGTVIQGFSGGLSQTGTLALDSGASLVLAGAAGIGGLVQVGGASKLTAAGTVTFTSPNAALLAINGGTMRFTNVNTTTGPTFVPILYSPSAMGTDSKSSIEFGTTGNAQLGALTIDSGITANLSGTIDGNVVVNGTLAVTNASLAIAPFGAAAPSVSGSGMLQIGSGGTLALPGSASVTIQFAPAGDGTLALASAVPVAAISGFAKGDTITLARLVTGLSYAQTGVNTGTLTLLNGNTSVGALNFGGAYAAQQFQVQFLGTTLSSAITYAGTPSTVPGNQISNTSDVYSWTNPSGGNWTNAANWTDTTIGTTASAAPGAGNAIFIQDNPGGLTAQIISGSGSALLLAISAPDSTVFTGNISVAGQLFLASGTSAGAVLQGGAQFSVGSLADYSALLLTGGSGMTVTGVAGGTEIVGSLGLGGGSTLRTSGTFDIGGGIVAVDATSVIEAGSAGGAATGTLTIDAGQLVTLEENGAIAAKLMVNGTLAVNNGTLEGFGGTTGVIGGSGTILIGQSNLNGQQAGTGRLTLNAADSAALVFLQGGRGILEVRGPLPTGTISGFVAGDAIQIDRTVTGASFQQTTTSQGTLTLRNGAAIVGTLAMSGNFTTSLFQVDPGAASGVATITLQTLPDTTGSDAASTGKDAYNWIGPNGGSWDKAANWADTTTGISPVTIPGSQDAVTLIGGVGAGGNTQYTTIGGNGAAAGLSVSGNVLMTGEITATGQVAVVPTSGQPATLALESGAKLTAASASINGTLEVAGGSAATIAGTALVTGGALLAINGGTVQLGSLIASGSEVIAIDASSMIKIGSVTSAAVGALTVASGATAALTGSIYGNVVNNGTLAVAGGGSLFIDMTGTIASDPYEIVSSIGGTGTLSIAQGGTLGLGAIDSSTIQFAGPNASLILAALPTGPLRGFVSGDTIQVDQTVTGIRYTQVTANTGTLTLTNGATAVGVLKFAGQYSNLTLFHVDSALNGACATITLQTLGVASVQPALIQGTMASDLLTATATGQTLTGLGGGDTLSSGGFGSVAFKDLTANINGDTIQAFVTSDVLDFSDMIPASTTIRYASGMLSVTDGTHSATLALGFSTIPTTGAFHSASDGAGGTKLTWS